jgi:hypothetical protein
MRKQFRPQLDLFAPPARRPGISDAEREKAVALLQILLTEATAKPPPLEPLANAKRGAADE